MRVLYVEDDARDADLARRELAQYAPKITVEVALRLSDARARLAAGEAYDLVLTDLRLPDGTGLDLLTEIRERSLPLAVVVLTGQGDEATAVAALKAGAEDYVPKREGYLARLPFVLEAALGRFRAEASRRADALRVLYAEHHAADIDLTRRHLATHAPHIRLDVVHSSGEVLARLPRSAGEPCPWDVLLLDYRLPGLNALDLLKTLHDERCLDVPVVLVTGLGDEEVAAQALRLGAADYLVKHPNYLFGLPAALENAHHRARLAREQSALQQKTAELEGYFTTSLDLFCIADTDGHFRRLNKEWESTLGYTIGELQGRRFLDFVHPDDVEATIQAVSRLAAQEQVVGFVNRYRHKDGSYRWFEWRSTPAGELIHAAARDITERKRAEDELTLKNVLLSTQQEASLDGILVVDEHGKILSFNQRFVDLWGVPPEVAASGSDDRALESALARVVDPESFVARVRHLYEHRDERSEEEIALRDGRTFDRYSAPMFGVDGRYYGRVWYFRDITRRKRAEQALHESEGRLQSLFAGIDDALFVHDREGRIIDCNEAACRRLGYSREEFLAMRTSDIDVPEFAEGFGDRLAEQFDQGRVSCEGVHLTKDGRRISVDIHTCVIDYHGEKAVLAVMRDITERKQAEDVLREAQEQLQRAVSAGDVGLWDWNLRTNEVYYSPEWKRQLGYEDHEISSAYDEWRSRVHPDDLEPTDRDERTSLTPPWPEYRSEYRLRHKDGSYRRILARGSLLFDEAGTPVRMLGSHVDITERAQLQEQFLQAQKMESVGRLAGGVAHDFNNLLTVINSSAELALDELKEGDPLREDLEQIRAAGVRAAGLTRQLLAFSRKQVLQPVVLNLSTTVAATEKMLRRLIGEDIDLTLVLAENVGSVKADPGQIEQVIVNLAVNARDAMPTGGKLTIETGDVELDEVYANQHAGTHPGSHVMLAISDTGTGMDEATLARIFEPFFTTKEAGRGTGLGLSTVYGIVRQSGGSVWVYSEIGTGTTFKIYLPRVAETARQVGAVPAQTPARGTETVLIVEDDMALRRAARRILSSAGYTVLEAADGAEALRMLEGHAGPLHLLLTDVIMPGLSGRETAERLGALRPGLKVLFSSGYADDAILRHGVLDPSVHFIAKPYAAAALTRKVREVLDSPD